MVRFGLLTWKSNHRIFRNFPSIVLITVLYLFVCTRQYENSFISFLNYENSTSVYLSVRPSVCLSVSMENVLHVRLSVCSTYTSRDLRDHRTPPTNHTALPGLAGTDQWAQWQRLTQNTAAVSEPLHQSKQVHNAPVYTSTKQQNRKLRKYSIIHK